MRKFIMLASVAALAALPATASAKPPHGGNGQRAQAERSGDHARSRNRARPRADNTNRNRNRVADSFDRRLVDRNRDGIDDRTGNRFVDRNRDGIDDRTGNRFVDRNRDGVDDRTGNRYGGANCPPGLANRTPACIPPGQARRLFREGQRVPTNFGAFTDYNDIPLQYRERYDIPNGSNYIYRDDSVYVVDPRTRLVTDIINLLRR